MTKQELIAEILKRFTGTPDEYEGVRAALPKYTVEELERMLRIKIAQAEADAAEERLIDTQAEIAADNFMWQLKLKEQYEQRQEAEAKRLETQDRRVFETAAKKYGWAINEAQFDIARRACGVGFTEYDLIEAVNSGKLSMATATPAALAQYAQERRQERADYLQNHASPAELRRAAVYETQQSCQQAQQEHVQAQIAHREELDARTGYPLLPETTADGVLLNSKFFIQATTDILRNFIKKYGAAQVTKAVLERI